MAPESVLVSDGAVVRTLRWYTHTIEVKWDGERRQGNWTCSTLDQVQLALLFGHGNTRKSAKGPAYGVLETKNSLSVETE